MVLAITAVGVLASSKDNRTTGEDARGLFRVVAFLLVKETVVVLADVLAHGVNTAESEGVTLFAGQALTLGEVVLEVVTGTQLSETLFEGDEGVRTLIPRQ